MWYLTNAFRSATVAPPTFDALRYADLQVIEAISRTACSAATAAARSAADRSARLAIESSGPPTPGALVAEANHGSAQAVLQQKRIQTVMNQSDGNQIKMTAIKTSLPLPLPRIYCLRFSFLLLFATLRPYQKQALLLTGSPSGVTISLNPMWA